MTEEQYQYAKDAGLIQEDDKEQISVTATVGKGGSVASAATKAANVAKAAGVKNINVKTDGIMESTTTINEAKERFRRDGSKPREKGSVLTFKDIFNV